MHVVLSSLGTDGDVYPYIGLGDVLRRRGHRVTLIAADRYEKTARQLDFDFIPMFTEVEMIDLLSNPRMWHPILGPQMMAKWGSQFLPKQYKLLDDACRNDALLVASPGLLAARVLRDKRDVPLVNLVLQPWMIKSNIAPPTMPGGLTLPARLPKPIAELYWSMINGVGSLLIGGKLQQLRKPMDLPRVKQIFYWWFSPDLVLGMFPDWYGMPQADWMAGLQLCGFPAFDGRADRTLPAETEAFCQAGPSPVAFTFGTGMMHAQRLFAIAVEACESAGLRAILLTPHETQLPAALPPTIHRCSYAPFGQLFPRCCAVVHHGGIGTTAKALAAGVPQLIVPMAYDQLDNGKRVKTLNAGTFIKPKKLSPNILADTVLLIQNQQTIDRCRSYAVLAAETDALQIAADKIELFWESRTIRG